MSPRLTVRCRRLLVAAGVFVLAGTSRADDPASVNALAGDSVRALQQRILADPSLTEQALALREDPAMQAALGDPDIAAALARGDYATLLADPRIQRLADNPALQGLLRDVAPAPK